MSKSNKPESRDAMDAVRELLFGEKAEEIESRFHRQELKFASELEVVEERISEKIQSFENFVRQEFESVSSKISKQADAAAQEKKAVAGAIADLTGRVDDDLEKVRQEASENQDNARKDLYSKFSELEDKLAKTVRELKKHAASEVDGLRETAADRQRIGDFMIDLGMRLQSDELKSAIGHRSEAENTEAVELAG